MNNINQRAFTPTGSLSLNHNEKNLELYDACVSTFNNSALPLIEKLESFTRFTTKRSIARFLVKENLFQKALHINGNIIECGVFNGAGLFTWAQLSNIFEPSNHTRKIVGFDTFTGFPSVDTQKDHEAQVGDLQGSSLDEIRASVAKNDLDRALSHIPNIELVSGDFLQTGPAYLKNNPHLLVSLLYLDFDLYAPTKAALELFLPRMPKGAIIAFDELNCRCYPGETQAFLEVVGVQRCSLKRFSYDPWISYLEL